MVRTAIVAGLALAAAVAVGSWAMLGGDGDGSPSAEAVAQGAELYAANCASCHGAEREGADDWRTRKPDGKLPAPPLDGSGHTWHHPDPQLIAIITRGVEAMAPAGYESDMPGFGDRLSADEIRAILAYLKSEWPDEKLARQREITDRAAQ